LSCRLVERFADDLCFVDGRPEHSLCDERNFVLLVLGSVPSLSHRCGLANADEIDALESQSASSELKRYVGTLTTREV